MNVLVIGGTQFMGPHVVDRLLAAGDDVTILHRGEHETGEAAGHIHADRREPGAVTGAIGQVAPEVVVDMVAMVEADGRELAAACVAGGVRRVVLASSIDVYRAYGRLHGTEPGPSEPNPLHENAPLRERLHPYRSDPARAADDPERWRDDYDKIPIERALLGAEGPETVVLRLPMVYGPEDRQHRTWPYVKRMLDGRETIAIGRTLARWRTSRGYVENVAAAIALAAHAPGARGVYNVAEQADEDEAGWIRAVGDAFGWHGNVVEVADGAISESLAPEQAQHSIYASSSRIRAELGYTEQISRAEALAATIAWEREHPPHGWPAALFDYASEDRALAAPG